MNKKSKVIFAIILVLIIQTLTYIISGNNKSYIHMDEAYSLGLASYNKINIQDNEDFYNNWHEKQYYEDYLTVNSNEIWNYIQVYENQKNDVHPPFYYLLLRIVMGFSINHYSKWPPIILNIIIYLFVTIFMYLILEKILQKNNNHKIKSLFLALFSSITLASITNVIYIRMYALSALNILVTTYLHIRLLEDNSNNNKILFGIGISALIGSLTHYYYLFYLVMLFIMFAIKYIKQKKYRNLIKYIVTMVCSGIISLIIFPYSIQHMFFGYRGKGVIDNLLDIPQFLGRLKQYIGKVNEYAFNNLFYLLCIIIIGTIIYKFIKKEKIIESKNKYIKYLVFPTLFYFILVSVASPWIELRYIMPICNIIFVLFIILLQQLLEPIIKEKTLNKIILGICLIIFIIPILFVPIKKIIPQINLKIEPEVLYYDKKEIAEKLKNNLNVPTIYFFNSNNDRFLDDILLFTYIDQSYIAKDIECEEENIKEILKNKDISNGIIVFINEGQENDYILNKLKIATNLENCQYLKRLNACDLYYLD